jgi:Putative transposase
MRNDETLLFKMSCRSLLRFYLDRYLGNYTHRVAISNHRLVALTNDDVIFRCRDSAHGNKKRLMTLPVDEFLRRFLLHLLPRGFVRIRNFGFLANRQRALLLPLCIRLLQGPENIPATSVAASPDRPHSPWKCPVCGATMHVLERLSAAQLLLRSPPSGKLIHDRAGKARCPRFSVQRLRSPQRRRSRSGRHVNVSRTPVCIHG